MAGSVIVIVNLYVRRGREAEFRRFETDAARIMGKHGGRIERVIRPERSAPEGQVPDEIHIVFFPNAESFEAYRSDGDLAALAGLRETAIERTEVLIGREAEGYH